MIQEFFAELVATFMLILLGDGVVANVLLKDTKGNNGGWVVITFAWGLAVYVGIIIAAPYSGAHLNPAVTLGLAAGGLFPWFKVWYFILAQLVGGFIGALFVWLFYKHHFDRTENQLFKLLCFCTYPAIKKIGNNFFSEVVATFVLVYTVFNVHGATFSAAELTDVEVGLGSVGGLPVALLVVVIGMALGGTTGYAINPARDLPPRIIHTIVPIKGKGSSKWGYSWVPILGPIIGGFIAALVYYILPIS
ncbi:MAG: MIP/aquaporin family protein [Hyphomicrobiales bacterium]